MKLKTVEIEGKTYAEVQDGKPLYTEDDGKEVAFDAPGTRATISRLNAEAKSHRERAEAAEAKYKPFEGLEDADAARKALETIKNIDEGKLMAAGKVEEIKAAAKKAAEEQVAAAVKAAADREKELQGENEKLQGQLHNELIGGGFARSKLIAEKFAIPADLVQARFGQAFKIEDGKIVAYDAAGNKVFSRARPGDIADFDEALETLVDQYPYKDQILKSSGANGGGAGGGGGTGGKKTMTRAQFGALDPAAQMAAAKDTTITD